MSFNIHAIKCAFEPLRSLANGSISAAYAAVGTALTQPARIIHFVNNTDGDMIFSDDATVVAGKIFVPARAMVILDLTTNQSTTQGLYIPVGTQWYVKQSSAPTTGSVYIMVMYSASA